MRRRGGGGGREGRRLSRRRQKCLLRRRPPSPRERERFLSASRALSLFRVSLFRVALWLGARYRGGCMPPSGREARFPTGGDAGGSRRSRPRASDDETKRGQAKTQSAETGSRHGSPPFSLSRSRPASPAPPLLSLFLSSHLSS